MAVLTLTDSDVGEVRLLLGADVTADDITDAQIKSDAILGASSDYVFEKIRRNMNL